MDVLSIAVPVPSYVLTYEQTNITQNISPYVTAITYVDHLQGESDELEIELEDSDGRWMNGWYPDQGDILNAKIGYSGSALLPLGDFEIDELSISGPPFHSADPGTGHWYHQCNPHTYPSGMGKHDIGQRGQLDRQTT